MNNNDRVPMPSRIKEGGSGVGIDGSDGELDSHVNTVRLWSSRKLYEPPKSSLHAWVRQAIPRFLVPKPVTGLEAYGTMGTFKTNSAIELIQSKLSSLVCTW